MTDSPPILVDGATGYVGNHVVGRLRQSALPVRALVRPGAHPDDVLLLRSLGADVIDCDLKDSTPELDRAFSGARAAVHLIGSIAPRRGESLADLHLTQTERLIDHCHKHGVPKVVMVTAVGTGPGAESAYHATKWQAEEALRASGLEYVILRPSLIVGRQVGRRDSKLVARYAELARTRAVVPLINGGVNLVQPVFIGDVADAVGASLADEGLMETTMELGGPDVVSMSEFVEALMAVIEKRKPVVGLPVFVARAAAFILSIVQPVPLLSADQVVLALKDSVCQENGLSTVLNITPTPLAAALATYRPEGAASAVPEAGIV